jgi:Tfp pilus assembly PilM family ATPase
MLVGFLDSLTSELLASFNYASHEYNEAPLGRLLLTGGGALIKGFGAHLENVSGVPVKIAAPAELLPFPPARAELCASPGMLLAMGLAMYPVRGVLPALAAA